MKRIFYLLFVVMISISMYQCSDSSFEEPGSGDDNDDNAGIPPVVDTVDDAVLTLAHLGYANTANATLVVKQIDSYEGSERQAYYLNGFLGLELPGLAIATSDSTRIFMDTDSLQIYVLYPNNNFTVLGWNGPKRQATSNYEILGDNYWVTSLRIDYSIIEQQLSFKGISNHYTPCSDEGWGRLAEITFDGLFNESINGYQGNFTWSESAGERGQCKITCTGTMELLLD